MPDPYPNQNQALYALQQRIQAQQQQQMRAESMAVGGTNSMATESMRVSMMLQQQQLQLQMQQQMQQLRSSMYGTFTAGAGAASPVMRQNFGSLVMGAGVARGVNTMTGGLLYPDYNYHWGLTRARMEQDASDELRQRMFSDVGNELIAGLVPDVIRRRTGAAFAGSRPEFVRAAYARYSGLRGGDVAAFGGGGNVDGPGLRLRADATQSSARAFEAGLLNLNRRLGYALGSDEVSMLQDVTAGLSVHQAFRGQRAGESVLASDNRQVQSLISSIHDLSRALQLNVDQTREMVNMGRQHGLMPNSSAFQALGAIGQGGNLIQMSNADRARYAMPIMAQARGMGMDAVTAVNRRFGSAEGVLGRYRAGLMSDAQLFRFGGTSEDDAAMRVAEYQERLGLGYASRFGGSLGALSYAGQSVGGAISTGARLGAVLGSNPLAGLRASMSGAVRSNMAGSMQMDAYAYAQDAYRIGESIQPGGGEVLAARVFGQMIGESDPVQAMNMYRQIAGEVGAVQRGTSLSGAESLRFVRTRRMMQQVTGEAPDMLDTARLYQSLAGRDVTAVSVARALALSGAGSNTQTSRESINSGYRQASVDKFRKLITGQTDPSLLAVIAEISNLDGTGLSVDVLQDMAINKNSSGWNTDAVSVRELLTMDQFLGNFGKINKNPDKPPSGTENNPIYVKTVS